MIVRSGGLELNSYFGTKLNNEQVDFTELEDEAIIELVHKGNSDALDFLIHKYRNFVRAKARSYFLIGADREDIVQEGMIGLYKAIRDYRGDKLASFKAFAELCITRQIITAELLSDLERKVLSLYLDGQSYQEISEELNRHVKSIDNALQRVKRKLERYLEIREFTL